MRNYFPLFVISSLLAGALVLQPSVARADSIPTISITSATGDATWGSAYPPGAEAALSGPNFTLGFQVPWPYLALSASAGDPFPGNTTSLDLSELTGHAEIPGGTLTVDGVTSSVLYDVGITARALTSSTVPSGTATLILPAVLSGSGNACLQGIGGFCGGTPPQPEVYIAQVDFEIPGLLTVNFSPGGPDANGELFSAQFTPTPEPSAWLLVLAGLGSLAAVRTPRRQQAL